MPPSLSDHQRTDAAFIWVKWSLLNEFSALKFLVQTISSAWPSYFVNQFSNIIEHWPIDSSIAAPHVTFSQVSYSTDQKFGVNKEITFI